MLSRLSNRISETFRDYRSSYYTKWVLSQYEKKNYVAIPKKLKSFKHYKYVTIEQYPFLFFIIGTDRYIKRRRKQP
jgi:hypothetical protein